MSTSLTSPITDTGQHPALILLLKVFIYGRLSSGRIHLLPPEMDKTLFSAVLHFRNQKEQEKLCSSNTNLGHQYPADVCPLYNTPWSLGVHSLEISLTLKENHIQNLSFPTGYGSLYSYKFIHGQHISICSLPQISPLLCFFCQNIFTESYSNFFQTLFSETKEISPASQRMVYPFHHK